MTTLQCEIQAMKLAHTKRKDDFLLSMLSVLLSLTLKAGVTERTVFRKISRLTKPGDWMNWARN